MPDAERAVQKAAATIPEDLIDRLVSADSLSDADRQTVVNIGRGALAGFQPQPDSEPEHKPEMAG
jgi:F-type H+-transporting ATPase subunit alpha